MLVIVFALGRPGSGKSTGAHHLTEIAWKKRLSAIRIGDYDILHQWFQEDTQHRFKPAGYGGFDVVDFSVLDDALRELKREVERRIERVQAYDDQLIIIEFARNNYCKALEVFDAGILKQAHFVYVDADVQTCIKHIHQRTFRHKTPDDHFVSEEIMTGYYATDDKDAIQPYLCSNFGVSPKHFHQVKNTGSHRDYTRAIEPVLNNIIHQIDGGWRVSAQPFRPIAEISLAGA